MKDLVEAGRFETVQRVRARTSIELAVIRQRINDRAVAYATMRYDALVQQGQLPDPKTIADLAFSEVELALIELLSGE